jgi:hypothetical protein
VKPGKVFTIVLLQLVILKQQSAAITMCSPSHGEAAIGPIPEKSKNQENLASSPLRTHSSFPAFHDILYAFIIQSFGPIQIHQLSPRLHSWALWYLALINCILSARTFHEMVLIQ